MKKMPFLVLLLFAIVALFACNPGFRKTDRQNYREISSYQYSQLHAAMNRYPEIAEAVLSELTGEYVTLSQYNNIMQKVDLIKLKHARQMTAQNARAMPVKAITKNM
jgi:hypothetical protein